MPKKKKQSKAPPPLKRNGPVPYEIRLRIVQAALRGMEQADVAVAFGVSVAAVQKFLRLFEVGGAEALRLKISGAAATSERRRPDTPQRREVIAAKTENPTWGSRRIRDVLARFVGLGVSETEVRRILHEEGLVEDRPPPTARSAPERRFERAEPNQMWQSDIFTFELRRNQRLYLAAFLDDHSRYLVSWALAHHQRSSLVIEAIERGLAEYGEPREVLTDQGRQYTAWRGETDFEHLLRRHGIAHVKSRPQHPQTLGKIERFWKTLWDEFLGKTVFADFADCQRRLGLYVQHYNFQRPHQALDGLVPADRFFRAAPHVRAAVEAQIAANALRLAQEKPPQKPFYLVGRLGDRDLSIAATGGALRVQMGDAAQTIPLPKESDDETQASRTFRTDEDAPTEGPAPAAGAALAHRPEGSRRGGAAALSAGALGPVGREAGDDGDRRDGHLAAALLPARDQGDPRDAVGAGAGGERGELAGGGEPGAPDRRPRGEGPEARAGSAAPRAALVPDPEDPAAGTGRDPGPRTAAEGAQLGGRWALRFAALDASSEADDDVGPAGFDPDAGWRDDAVSWRRKLAGAIAPSDGGDDDDGAAEATGRSSELPRQADGAGGHRAALRDGVRGAGQPDVDERGGADAGDRAAEHADPGAPRAAGGAGGGDAEAERPGAEAGARAGAGGRADGAAGAERQARASGAGDGRDAGLGGRDHPGPAWASAADVAALLAALHQDGDRDPDERRRGPRATPIADHGRANDPGDKGGGDA